MKITDFAETVAKSRTINGLPCILVERPSASHGQPCESEAVAVFKDDEIGNALADELVEKFNYNKIRM